jgi:hypothetical protein
LRKQLHIGKQSWLQVHVIGIRSVADPTAGAQCCWVLVPSCQS